MRKIETWIAFDGTHFSTEDECYQYEKFSPLGKPDQIQFYDSFGQPTTPTEDSLLHCDSFIVYNITALHWYHDYCLRVGITAPKDPGIEFNGQWHFVFINGEWVCMEKMKESFYTLLKQNFNKTDI